MNRSKKIILGTRGSKLALLQANRARDLLLSKSGALQVEIKTVKTKGDIVTDKPLSRIGEEGLFTKAIEEELLAGLIDVGVHSAKDMPTVLSQGLRIAAYPEREDFRDALLAKGGVGFKGLKKGAVIGTSSLRRRAFLKRMRPDLAFADLRGNVDTRIGKLYGERFDAIIMAYAAVKRMNLEDKVSEIFEPQDFLPAAGQGALALETRAGDDIEGLIEKIDAREVRICVEAERAFLRRIEGGCSVPVGCFAKMSGDSIKITGAVADLEGERYASETITGESAKAIELSLELALRLLDGPGGEILDAIRRGNG